MRQTQTTDAQIDTMAAILAHERVYGCGPCFNALCRFMGKTPKGTIVSLERKGLIRERRVYVRINKGMRVRVLHEVTMEGLCELFPVVDGGEVAAE